MLDPHRADTERMSDPSHPTTEQIDKPKTPFDDVQCHECEKYRYAPTAPDCCENCGAAYDWAWNVRTGRIAQSSLPDRIELTDDD